MLYKGMVKKKKSMVLEYQKPHTLLIPLRKFFAFLKKYNGSFTTGNGNATENYKERMSMVRFVRASKTWCASLAYRIN